MRKPSLAESRRLASVQRPVIPVVVRWMAETPGTISLGQGLVSYGPPSEAIDAARRFGDAAGDHHYTPIEGLPEFVDAIEAKLAAENGIRVGSANRVIVTAGGNLAFMNAALAILDAGDEVIFPAPYYFNHEMAVVMAGGRPVPVPTTPDYQLDVDAIADAITPRTRAVVTVSPHNPTGVVYPADDLSALNVLCRDRGLFHIHDEAYEYFTYEGARHFSPGSMDDAVAHTISLYSMSKAFGFASWRIGYMVVPRAIWSAIDKIQDTVIICAPAISQQAGMAAIRTGRAFADPHVARLAVLRDTMRRTLAEADVPCAVSPSTGAFYYFLRVSISLDSMTLAERLVREHRVAVVPGNAFGDASPCSLRLSYGMLDDASAAEGLARFIRGVRALAVA